MFSEVVGNFLTQHFGIVFYLAVAFGLFLVGPVLLVAALARVLDAGRRGWRVGLRLGALVAAWASLCWLVVPYCGGYPCLPGLIVLSALGESPVDTIGEEFLVHAVNFLLWPLAGALIFQFRDKLSDFV